MFSEKAIRKMYWLGKGIWWAREEIEKSIDDDYTSIKKNRNKAKRILKRHVLKDQVKKKCSGKSNEALSEMRE